MTWGNRWQEGTRKGPWMHDEDMRLVQFVTLLGDRRWDYLAVASGLNRSGKSCRMRWMNYLKPDIKRGRISSQEEKIILQLHARWGNKWSRIARQLPGRTDNEIKNYWRTNLRKKSQNPALDAEEKMQGEIEAEAGGSDSTSKSATESISGDRQSVEDNDADQSSKDAVSVVLQLGLHINDDPFAASPYEAWLCDWMSGMVNDTDSSSCSIVDSGFCFPAWVPGNLDTVWECCLGSLWDIDPR